MAAIWNDIELEWDGETYTVKPTIEFLNHIEQGNGSSLSSMLMRMGQGDLPAGRACELVAKTLNYAGAKVTAEEIFKETGGLRVELLRAAQVILIGCMPAPQETGTKKKAVKKKK